MTSLDDRSVLDALDRQIVGRRRELELLLAALAAGRHVLLEGPPGTGKSTMLRAAADAAHRGFVFVEGNAELTPARLAGQFDPSRVISEGYVPDVFVDGPLLEALREGSLLYVEELNRVPEETVNLLITVMSEGELNVPRIGRVAAADGFRIVAAMNPFDNIGTSRVAGAIYDRICRITMEYQTAADEEDIVEQRAGEADEYLLSRAVAVTRLTRNHSDIRVGSSVRGAIDQVEVARRLAVIRGTSPDDADVGLDAALVALSGRIRLHEGGDRTPEDVIRELWAFVIESGDSTDDPKPPAPKGAKTASR